MNIEIVITWYENEPISLWFNDRLIWESDRIILETNLLETKIFLPFVEAIKFSMIFIEGLIGNRLIMLLDIVNKQIQNLLELENKNE